MTYTHMARPTLGTNGMTSELSSTLARSRTKRREFLNAPFAVLASHGLNVDAPAAGKVGNTRDVAGSLVLVSGLGANTSADVAVDTYTDVYNYLEVENVEVAVNAVEIELALALAVAIILVLVIPAVKYPTGNPNGTAGVL